MTNGDLNWIANFIWASPTTSFATSTSAASTGMSFCRSRPSTDNSDKQNARIEHDKALPRVMTALLKDDTELFRKFIDDESIQRWLADTVFRTTCQQVAGS